MRATSRWRRLGTSRWRILASIYIHLLLGQLAVGLGDEVLLGEAKAFLAFLKKEQWERKLDLAVKAGSPDFADPE